MRTLGYPSFRSIFPPWALLLSLANAASYVPVDGPNDVWFGWPFVYYGNETRFSAELTVYSWPLLLTLALDLALAALVIAPIYHRIISERLERHVFNLSVATLVLSVLFVGFFCVDVSASWGPRNRLETSVLNRFVVGPRNETNFLVSDDQYNEGKKPR